MKNILLFTDPHIGLNRHSHTTPASRARLKENLIAQAASLTSVGFDATICLGDLFDSHDVDNGSLIDGINIYQSCDLTLFGNHDLSNRSDIYSAIEVASEVTPTSVPRRPAWEPKASMLELYGVRFWFIDHKLNQTIFEEALQYAYDRAEAGDVLLLHCNYNSPFASQESTLNLSEENAHDLLDVFDYVFIGHEHRPRELYDGRIMLLGNTHPTGFADISDKFAYKLIIDDRGIVRVEKSLIWSEELNYLEVDWTELSELTQLGDSIQFISVNGAAHSQHGATISRQVADLWKLSDNLLMVRNNVSLIGAVEVNTLDQELVVCKSIPERISEQLKDTKLAPVWEKYLNDIL